MSKDNGGPAFPVQNAAEWQAHGMTLRDYFAAHALPGLMGRVWSDPVTGVMPDNVFELWADGAYATADAMLAERAK